MENLNNQEDKNILNDTFSIKSLSISQRLSQKYKNLPENKKENKENMQNSNSEKKNQNANFLFNKRENKMIDILEEREKKKNQKNQTGKIVNDFLFEMQKLLGVKNPLNLIENLEDVNNEDLIKKLQKMYKIVHYKANVE